jgi:hypothetical protein
LKIVYTFIIWMIESRLTCTYRENVDLIVFRPTVP